MIVEYHSLPLLTFEFRYSILDAHLNNHLVNNHNLQRKSRYLNENQSNREIK